ncbi:MAG: 2-succinyl-5-enolpyruvyl-6-hydroxy-3-cyclohexene-1-carboxylic-acid synthase [Acidimicrobiia bacterium]
MTHPNPSTALARVVVDELVAGGVRFVAISPGSRSGALAIAAAGQDGIETRMVLDERSAGFHALGVARASGRPAAVITTSGTAAANLLPAVVEADLSGVPLIVITADRPAELQGVGANQTIDQVELFGAKARIFRGIEAPGPDLDANRLWRETVRSVVGHASGPFPGPGHLNVAFREPTVPVSDDGRSSAPAYQFPTPRLDDVAMDPTARETSLPTIDPGRGLVVGGDGPYDRAALLERSRALGWPFVATALSGLRGEEVVSAYHFTLASGVPDRLRPRTVVAVGGIGPDPVLEDLVAAAPVRLRVDAWGRHIDPRRNATSVLAADPLQVLAGVEGRADEDWAGLWLGVDKAMRARVLADVTAEHRLSGGSVAEALNAIAWEALVVSSSLPIREVDAHLARSGPVFANRGASGIDGFVSTALGVATVSPRTLAISGDLSLLHDSNGLLHDGDVDLTLVVVDNGGGGLFDSLPQATYAPDFERLFVTPPHRDLAALAVFHGARAQLVASRSELIAAVSGGLDASGIDVVVVPVDRVFDLEARRRRYD